MMDEIKKSMRSLDSQRQVRLSLCALWLFFTNQYLCESLYPLKADAYFRLWCRAVTINCLCVSRQARVDYTTALHHRRGSNTWRIACVRQPLLSAPSPLLPSPTSPIPTPTTSSTTMGQRANALHLAAGARGADTYVCLCAFVRQRSRSVRMLSRTSKWFVETAQSAAALIHHFLFPPSEHTTKHAHYKTNKQTNTVLPLVWLQRGRLQRQQQFKLTPGQTLGKCC